MINFEDPVEKDMFVVKPPPEFYKFLKNFVNFLREIGSIMVKDKQ